MNTYTYTITDTITGTETTCDAYNIADSIRPWFADAPTEITEAIQDLENAVRAGEYTGELESFLAVRVS